MTRGMNNFELKDRRRQRRRNHIAKDLKTEKYRQRIVPDSYKDKKRLMEYEEDE